MQINRQRWLPPVDFTDPVFGSFPALVRVTMCGLRLYVDDWGREEVRLRKMLAEIFEHDESVSSEDLEGFLLQLDEVNWLRLYVDGYGRSLMQIRFWPAVQHPDKNGSRFAPPPGFMKPSRTSQETFTVEERGRAGARAGEHASARGGEHLSRDLHDAPQSGLAPPSPFCSQHQPWGTEEPCGPCRTALLALRIWERAAASTALPSPATPPASRDALAEPEEYVMPDGRVDHT